MSDKVQVRVEGAYENGHTYDRVVTIEEPTAWEYIEDWWWDVVWPETGDGVLEDMGSWHKATVLAPGKPYDGATYEWVT